MSQHYVRSASIAIGAIAAASVLTACAGGVTTTPSGTTAPASASPAAKASAVATHSAAPAGIGSYFDVADATGDTYRVTLVKIIDPAQGADQFTTPDAGKRFAGVVFTITAIKGSPQHEDADGDAAVVGSNGQTYQADFSQIAGYTNFNSGEINVAQGDSTTGAVAFQVPSGVKVARVQWSPAGFGQSVQWQVP